ncbi:hypothetical protein Bbelb_200740 [Branchiostoma belcheri]|nr:hypothetical protein Bbelb_200740 [Branchiostoma belcheri]
MRVCGKEDDDDLRTIFHTLYRGVKDLQDQHTNIICFVTATQRKRQNADDTGAKRALATSAPYQTSVSSSHVRYYSTSDVPDEPQDGQWLLFNAAVITVFCLFHTSGPLIRIWCIGERVPAYHQVLYLGNERFLPPESPLRTTLGKPGEEGDPPPRKKTKEEVYAYGRAVEVMKKRVSRGETKARAFKKSPRERRVWKSCTAFHTTIPSRAAPLLNKSTTTQVLVKKIFSLINGHVDPFKTLDAEKTIGRFTHITMEKVGFLRSLEFLKNEGMNIDCIASDQKTPN